AYLDPSISNGSCTMTRTFTKVETLEQPKIQLPLVSDASTLVYGQRLVLKARSPMDEDELVFNCQSSCGPVKEKKINIKEDIVYKWRLEGKGVFESTGAKTATGSSVIYKAPNSEEGMGKVKIYCKATNRATTWSDPASSESQVEINIYRPFVEIVQPISKEWLPTYNATIDMTTRLVYYTTYSSTEPPKAALDHMCTVYNLELEDVTNYGGVCSNWDAIGNDAEGKKLDLYFDAVKHMDHWSPMRRDNYAPERRTYLRMRNHALGDTPQKAEIEVKDYGAYAKLTLDYLDTKNWEWNYIHYKIPKDDKSNRMGDSSPHNKYADGLTDLNRDRDDKGVTAFGKPPVENRGDGYTLFEEYRGFMVCQSNTNCNRSKHVRTDPKERTLFLTSGLDFTFKLFLNASGVRVYRMEREYHMDETRWVNRFEENMFVFGGKQYGLIIEPGAATFNGEDNLGRCHWEGGAEFANLKFASRIEINMEMIGNGGYRSEEVVAHEIGHACGIEHHGKSKKFDLVCFQRPRTNDCFGSGKGTMAYFAEDGTQNSGNLRCFMRYEQNFFYKKPGTNIRKCTADCDTLAGPDDVYEDFDVVVDLPRGTELPGDVGISARNLLCNDTGENSPAGKCAPGAGNCFSKLKIKTW
ncbi:MAG: hypothetical protein AAFV80_03750, partial [Bacteroidota bacterium]